MLPFLPLVLPPFDIVLLTAYPPACAETTTNRPYL
jgi:hypothetical protein